LIVLPQGFNGGAGDVHEQLADLQRTDLSVRRIGSYDIIFGD